MFTHMLKKLSKQYLFGTHCGGLQLSKTHAVSFYHAQARLRTIYSLPRIQTEILPALDHAPSCALRDGTTFRMLAVLHLTSQL